MHLRVVVPAHERTIIVRPDGTVLDTNSMRPRIGHVSLFPKEGWRAVITPFGGPPRKVGSFKTEEEAARALWEEHVQGLRLVVVS